ncbi:uncharacterized protein LOC110746083, partial [Prunus avium]|uniref:Uncharacterized protein LOC110746083 n=1 Tax=Prunus avium TaxID=42229 RepID=A0A6P5RM24_PRUAV
MGLSSLQKTTAALRMLAYRVAADYADEYVRIEESTAIESIKKFVKAIIAIFGEEYLRFYLEAVASYDLWIWHAFFGLPGSHNDINVLERSTVFGELVEGRAPPVNYSVNGHNYTM